MSANTTTVIKIDATAKLDGVGTAHDYKYKAIMTSVETFKTSVIRIRDILRGPGVWITGMDSMRHICLYLLSRYMTRAKVASLEVPEEFAWETLIETAQTKNGGVQKALDCFYHSEEDCLVRHFDRLFGTDKFSFDIKNSQKHKEILEILNAMNMVDVDCQMDILGWVYEQHLRTGSSAARDLGQFFTDRFICGYMTELCRPGFKSPGVPESVCDPSMGTGGFLTAFIKYFKKHHADKPIDWSVQQKEIHGCDTDPKVAGVSRLNLFMETGGNRTTNLLTHDSLYGDLTQTGYDIILANMPFGLDGIKHAECCGRVKALKIRGTKSEPLFLQLMMVSLNMGGRCAVVVPDGMLVNSSSCHKDTRKYLLDHFDLKRVIKMKGLFFMNTGIQPSILFFEKTGKPTEAVEFWEVVKGDKGEITETMVVSVPRTKIDASSSFYMRRYLESEKPVANPAGFPMVKLSEVCDLLSGKGNYTQDGDTYPYYDSNGPTGTRKDFLYNGEFVITARKMSIGAVHYVSGKYWASDNTINIRVKPDSSLSSRFLYYWLLLNNKVLKDLSSGIKPGIRKSDVAEIKMPLPPLPIQQEIVTTLDRIYNPGTTELANTLKMTDMAMDLVLANPAGATLEPIVEAQQLIYKSVQMMAGVKAQMLADIKAQMLAVVKASCVSGEEKSISEVVKLKYGFPFKSSDYTTEGLAVVKHNNISDGRVSKSKKQDYIPSFTQADDYKMVVGDIVISMDFDCGKVGKIVEDGWVLNQRVCLARANSATTLRQEYLYWLLRFGGFYEKMQSLHTGTTIKHISGKDIDRATLKVPSLAVQDATLNRLAALQSQFNALETLQKQSEDNARFILETYLGPTGSSEVVPDIEENKEDELNEIINPEEVSVSEVVASTESPVKKVVKRKKPVIAKPVLGSDGLVTPHV
jgi:restriction endonuclease S subunit